MEDRSDAQPQSLAAYLQAAAAACDLPIDATMQAGVIANLERTRAFARLLREGEDPSRIEPSTIFTPREA